MSREQEEAARIIESLGLEPTPRRIADYLRVDPEEAKGPLIVRLPADVSFDQAAEWIEGAIRLGLIERPRYGVQFIPADMVWP